MEMAITLTKTRYVPKPIRTGESHDVSITAITSGREFFLLRRHSDDKFEPNKLNNISGHIDRGEDGLKTAVRELKEEAGIDVERMPVLFLLDQKHRSRLPDPTIIDLGSYSRQMVLETSSGKEYSLVHARMFLFHSQEVHMGTIKLSGEHVDVWPMSFSMIREHSSSLTPFDRYYFEVNKVAFKRLGINVS